MAAPEDRTDNDMIPRRAGLLTPMQIYVAGVAPILTPQVRAYAEYKVFSRLAPLARNVDMVQVVVTEAPDEDGGAVCAVTADLGDAGFVRTRVRRPQATGAIDLAAENVARAAARRLTGVPGPA